MKLLYIIYVLFFPQISACEPSTAETIFSQKRSQLVIGHAQDVPKISQAAKRIVKRKGLNPALFTPSASLTKNEDTGILPTCKTRGVFLTLCAEGHERAPPVI